MVFARFFRGPLSGLKFIETSAKNYHIPKLLGCYEQPLLPYIEKAIEAKYAAIVNIGSAEGYYAVGMGLRLPNTVVHAYDLSMTAQSSCRNLAELNGISERVTIGSLFKTDHFSQFRDMKTLIICDIEGGEVDLLDPYDAPALRQILILS